MRTRIRCVALGLLCVSAPAAAQTVLSEADALARLSADSPRVRAIRADVDVARAEALVAARWPNPRITYNREAVAGVSETMWLITQPLPVTGRRELEMRAASALTEARARRADEEMRRARAALKSAYADLVSAQVRETELGRSRDRLRELAVLLARRESEGESAGYDRIRAEREVAEIDAEWSAAQTERARAQAEVAGFFASTAMARDVVAVVPSPHAPVSLPDAETLLSHAEMVRGEPAALRQEIESAQFAERAAGRRLVPEPEIVAGTKSSSLLGGDIGSVLSVHASIPLFDRARPEHATAAAKLAQAHARAEAFHASVAAQIAALRAAVMERRDAAERYRESATQSAERLERIAQVSYDAGERGILELLDAYRSGAAARLRQAVLDSSTRQAEIELELVTGWEIP